MRNIVQILLIIALSIGMVYTYFHFKPDPQPVGEHNEAVVAKEIKKIDREVKEVKALKVYKPVAKAKLKLPKAILEDDNQQVIASSKVSGDERPHTITTVVNTATGESGTLDRIDPYPFMQVKTTSEIGAFYGLKQGKQVIRLEGKQEFLQVKAVHLGITGSIDSDKATFVGLGAWVRW